ncbi:hypothetical protein J437_LFUL003319, partial [Ladona fulva]
WLAIVKRVRKGKVKNDFNVYRPISILPALDEVIEKNGTKSLMNLAQKYNHVSLQQYVEFLDFQKAFDVTKTITLLQKLCNIGIRGMKYKCFDSKPQNRKLMVKFKMLSVKAVMFKVVYLNVLS